jgi:hypothetical protein
MTMRRISSRSAENIPKEIDKARIAMEAGMFLGAPILRTFVGSPPSPDKQEEAFRRGVDALRKTAEIGAELSMTTERPQDRRH